jgi:hypothetical protein
MSELIWLIVAFLLGFACGYGGLATVVALDQNYGPI